MDHVPLDQITHHIGVGILITAGTCSGNVRASAAVQRKILA